MSTTLKRFLLQAKANILDEKNGIIEYLASDQTIDSDREIVMAKGWRFDEFAKNSPFVDSHDYSSIEHKLGEVVDYRIDGDSLIETVKWLKDVPEHRLATIGWKMTLAGMPPACSVGFTPINAVNRKGSSAAWNAACQLVNQDPLKTSATRICLEQQQRELSAVIIGANPNAVAKSYKAGALTDDDLQILSDEYAKRVTADETVAPADVSKARQRARTAFLLDLQQITKTL